MGSLKKKNRLEEQKLQMACVKWFRLQYPDKILFAVNNNSFGSGISNARMGAINKACGVLAGVSDLILLHKGKSYFIEMKYASGRQSPNQKAFQREVEAEGFTYKLIRTFDEFMEYVNGIIR